MKKQILLILGLAVFTGAFATVHTVSNSGFTFSPATLTVMEGDTIDFTIGGSHNVVEVDSSTWASNGNTPLSGGFSAPFGGGMVILNSVGTFYYVCNPHASQGMKGQIRVEAAVSSVATLKANDISVYPNPASERLTIDLPSDHVFQSVEISNLKGQVILSQSVDNAVIEITLPASAQGVYLLRLHSAQGVLNKKIILE
jgi:plastocyanin